MKIYNMKICFRCKKSKPLDCYYKHKGMSDGHLNKCKDCTKQESSVREKKLRLDSNWVEKERERHRDKYNRLGYKEKQKEWDKLKPWKKYSEYKNLSRDLRIPKGFSAHHWSYKRKNIRSVFIMTISNHKKAHTLLDFSFNDKCFKTKSGALLNTRLKHEIFLKRHNLF